MTSRQRALSAFAFQRPDRIPRFDYFWEYPAEWSAAFGPVEDQSDIAVWAPDESPFPSQARVLREEGGWITEADGWGRTVRRRDGAYFHEVLQTRWQDRRAMDRDEFEPADLPERYRVGHADDGSAIAAVGAAAERHCLFGKTGGPYLRSTLLRGEQQFLLDIAGDPALAAEIAGRVGDHLTRIGVEQLRRWPLGETGIWVYDDIAHNGGLFMRPASFERIFLPVYRRMFAAYRAAGATTIAFHSDGDVRDAVDMLVDAGIDALHPLERRSGMDPFALRRAHPGLALVGGLDNTGTLVHGPAERIAAETRALIELGRDGGLVIGTHSVSPETPMAHFAAYRSACIGG